MAFHTLIVHLKLLLSSVLKFAYGMHPPHLYLADKDLSSLVWLNDRITLPFAELEFRQRIVPEFLQGLEDRHHR